MLFELRYVLIIPTFPESPIISDLSQPTIYFYLESCAHLSKNRNQNPGNSGNLLLCMTITSLAPNRNLLTFRSTYYYCVLVYSYKCGCSHHTPPIKFQNVKEIYRVVALESLLNSIHFANFFKFMLWNILADCVLERDSCTGTTMSYLPVCIKSTDEG